MNEPLNEPLPRRWQKSTQSLRAVQLAFEFEQSVSDTIRLHANRKGLSTSDQIRTIIGLETKQPPKRPRLTVSLSQQDYQILGEHYQLPADDKTAIRKAISAELIDYTGKHHAK